MESRNPESLPLPPHTCYHLIHNPCAFFCTTELPGCALGFQKGPPCCQASFQVTVSRLDARERSGPPQLCPGKRQTGFTTTADVVFLKAYTPPFGETGLREARRPMSSLPTLPCHLSLNRGIGAPGDTCFCLGKQKPYNTDDASCQSTDFNGRHGRGFYNKLNRE